MKTLRVRRLLATALCGGVLTLAAAAPAGAALFDDTEARLRIEQTNQRIEQLRRQLEERFVTVENQLKNQGLVDIFNQIEQLKREVAQLRGQLEVVNYELSEAQKRQRDLYVDLDSRLRRLETAGAAQPRAAAAAPSQAQTPPAMPAAGAPADAAADAHANASVPSSSAMPGGMPMAPAAGASFGPSPAVGGTAPGRGADVAGEQRSYDSALDLFKAGSYGAAVQSFASFLRSYPRSALAPSAQYWIGNAQFALRDFRAAIASQRQLIATYPDSQKVPDAMLNLATSQFELGETVASRRTLDDLIARFPQSEAAAKARQRLSGR